jgi:hypothetical protein
MVFFREPNERREIVCGNPDVFSNFASSSIPRRAKNLICLRRLPQFPCKRVLATAAANDENSHRLRVKNQKL